MSNSNTEFIVASERQIAATAQTRARVRRRVKRWPACNALTHGLTAARVVISGEVEKGFNAFQAGIFADLRPTTPFQAETAAHIVATLRILRRVPDLERAITLERYCRPVRY